MFEYYLGVFHKSLTVFPPLAVLPSAPQRTPDWIESVEQRPVLTDLTQGAVEVDVLPENSAS